MQPPIIDPTQSIQDYRQGEYFNFQIFAYNFPTAWAAVNLPTGIFIDELKGIIYGACLLPGPKNFGVRAFNSAGWSAEQRFTIEIQNNGLFSLDPVIELEVDVVSRTVLLPGTTTPATLTGKFGDTLPLRVRFTKNGTGFDPQITTLAATIKEFEADPALVLTQSTDWRKALTGSSTYYDLLLPLVGDPLKGALSNYGDDKSDDFPGIAEIQWQYPLAWTGGTRTITLSSQTFAFTPVRDLIPNS